MGGRGIAYEWMFDLCNRMHADCWITVPHLAIETYEQLWARSPRPDQREALEKALASLRGWKF